MKFRAIAAPSGAAARLIVGMPAGSTALVVATTSGTPPDPDALTSTDRVVADASTDWRPSVWPFEAAASHALTYGQMLDLHTSLRGTITHYHAWVTTPAGTEGPVTQEVDARDPARTAVMHVARDLFRERIEYHIARAVTADILNPNAGYIPVLERETLNTNDPIPAILLRETISPTMLEGIGKDRRGDVLDAATGKRYREEVHRYRARIDLLAISENPVERGLIAKVLHEGLLVDFALLEDVGYREMSIQRMMQSGNGPEGYWQFAEEIAIDGIIEAVTREEHRYTVPSETTFYTDV